jgi:hypothetical protein
MLATLVLAALGAGALFPAPGAYRYTASMGGQSIGSWSVNVASDGGSTTIAEESRASIAGLQLAATASLVLGPDLAPTRYDGHYRTPGQSPSVSVALTPTSATVVGAFTSAPQQVPLGANTHHFVVIEPGLLAGLFALPAQLDSWKDSAVTWVTPTTAQAQSLTTGSQTTARPAGVPAHDVLLSIDHPIAVTIWYDPSTHVPDEISVPSQNAVLTRQRP